MKIRRHMIRITLVWFGISVIIGIVTFVVCGSFQPILFDNGYPDYTSLEQTLFLIAKVYTWPITFVLSGIGEVVPFDIFVSPFLLEVADIKFGPGVIVLYALFYSSVTLLVLKLFTIICNRNKVKSNIQAEARIKGNR